MSGAALLEVTGLTLGYGRSDVIKGVNLRVASGAAVTLIGANGAGKTTIMRALSGLLKPRAGSILFDGARIDGLPGHRVARLGVIQSPEGRQVFANLTIAENLALGAWLLNDAREESRRREGVLARFPRLAERLDQPAGSLSGGEQQMLAIGRALMSNPRLLLLDEPSLGLAPLFIEEIFRIIEDLKREGRTILIVEQNASAALDVTDYAYVLQSGVIEIEGPAAEVAADPRVVAAYLGG
jgi:branched-chain amino acid transport system ATP-binding protein